jgi:uncharacterized protein YbjT (DUF2867 family)
MILVTGATGNIGGELVGALTERGEQVRALVRQPEDRLPPGVEQVAADLNAPDSMRPALAGVRGLFLLPGYQNMPGTLDEARQAGVEQVVLVSSSSIEGGDPGNAVTRYMMDSEAAVRASGLAWGAGRDDRSP